MNGAVVAIVSAFFIIGITVGIIAVVAMSARRAGRPGDTGDPPEFRPRGRGEQPPEAGWHDAGSDHQQRWPGDVDNDVSG